MISFKEFDAMVVDIIWRDKLACLIGPEWDMDGSHLIEVMWEKCYLAWGDYGVDFILEYISWITLGKKIPAPYITTPDGQAFAVSIEILWELLNKYFEPGEEA